MRKDLGALPRTLLENFLKEVFKTFKNFKQGDFYSLLFVVRILGVAILRATNSGCSEPHSASEMRTTTVSLRYRIEVVGKLVVD